MTSPETPTPVPVRATVRAAFRLVADHPRQILLPITAIQLPVTLLTTFVVLFASLTYLQDEPLDPFEAGARNTLFLYLVTMAAQLLLAQVARAGAVAASAAAATGSTLAVSEALDPAFSRMGGLLTLALAAVAIAAIVVVPIAGWILAPYLGLRTILAFEAFVLEGVAPFQALGRSWEITRRRVLTMLGVVLLTAVVLVGPLLLVNGLSFIVQGSRTQQVFLSSLYSLVAGTFLIPVVAFITATTTLFYLQATGAISDVRGNARGGSAL